MNRLRIVALSGLFAVAVLAPTGTAWSQPRREQRKDLRNEIHRDRQELNTSRQEFRSDRQDLGQDRRELRQDRRSGASADELAHGRADVNKSLDEFRDSRRDFRDDRRDLNRDLNEYQWRFGDRGRDSYYSPGNPYYGRYYGNSYGRYSGDRNYDHGYYDNHGWWYSPYNGWTWR